MDYLELQKKILTLAEHKVGKNCEPPLLALLTQLRTFSFRGEPWPLRYLSPLARKLEIRYSSELLAAATHKNYQDFFDDKNIPENSERGIDFLRKKLKEIGWTEPILTLKELLSLSEKMGKGVDYVFALLNGEEYEELTKQAFRML